MERREEAMRILVNLDEALTREDLSGDALGELLLDTLHMLEQLEDGEVVDLVAERMVDP